jgi:pimeloyl-ACP methyl ester carboxylesterase
MSEQSTMKLHPTTDLELQTFIEGEGRPLVVLGGGTYGARALEPHARMLGREFLVARLQTLNVERSEQRAALPQGYSVKLEAAAMRHTLDRLSLGSPLDVFGWSYGALVCLDFALDHPDRVHTLSLFEPPALWMVSAADRRAAPDMRLIDELGARLGSSGEPTDDDYIRFLEALGNPGIRPPDPQQPQYVGWTIRRAALRCLPAISAHHDVAARAAAFDRPVLVMIGTETVPFHRQISNALARTFPDVERVELPGGHAAPITAREEFVSTLRSFLARHPLPRGR